MDGEAQDPVAWLRRQVQARLALARHAIELGSAAEWTELSSGVLMTIAPDAPQDNWDGVHPLGDSSLTRLMEANDPQDTIARCEAELAILDEHGGEHMCYENTRDGNTWDWYIGDCRVMRHLFGAYRFWSGYDERWTTAAS